MNRNDLSELVAGKVIEGKIAPSAVNSSDLVEPYDRVMRLIQGDKNWSIDKLIQEIGYYPIEQATVTASKVNGIPADWPKLLHESTVMWEVGQKYESASKRLQRGEKVDHVELIQLAHRLSDSTSMLQNASEIDPETVPFQKSSWNPLDVHIGGLPKSGLTVVGAPPGVGKTSMLIKMAAEGAKQGQKSLIFSMEMTSQQLLYRLLQLEQLPDSALENIIICDDILTPGQVSSIASTLAERPHFVGIDFAELMFSGDSYSSSENVMAGVYLTLARAAKQMDTPFVLLSQLSRSYQGGMPEITHLRYTGMAEALASLILLIYNPSAIFVSQSSGGALPRKKGKGYIIVGKSRYGHNYPGHGRFAIETDWDGATGWGTSAGIMKPL